MGHTSSPETLLILWFTLRPWWWDTQAVPRSLSLTKQRRRVRTQKPYFGMLKSGANAVTNRLWTVTRNLSASQHLLLSVTEQKSNSAAQQINCNSSVNTVTQQRSLIPNSARGFSPPHTLESLRLPRAVSFQMNRSQLEGHYSTVYSRHQVTDAWSFTLITPYVFIHWCLIN
jgi:hypothetical protein